MALIKKLKTPDGNVYSVYDEAAIHTLPVASETVSGCVKVGDGLSMTNGVLSADGIETYTTTNPALTASSGVCTWTVSHGLNSVVDYNITDVSSGESMMATVIVKDANTLTVKIASTSNIAAGKYKITVMEVSA